MKKILNFGAAGLLLLVCVLCFGTAARAGGGERVKQGVYAEHINLSGMTKEEACLAVESFVAGLRDVQITLRLGGGTMVNVTLDKLGVVWANPGMVDEALSVGRRGNVIRRYKELKDLERRKLVYSIDIALDLQAVSDFLTNWCAVYDSEAVNLSLARENGEFRIIEGRNGYKLNVESSVEKLNDYLTGDWDYRPCVVDMAVDVTPPKGSAEELMRVKDVLGSFTTSYAGSAAGRKVNIANGCSLIDGVTLYPDEELSAYQLLAPVTVQNGYDVGGAFVDGKVVESVGGGICQVSSTLYNAVLRAELSVTKRYNHSMTVSYVDISADAALAESVGKDLRFVNSLEHPIYIEGRTEDDRITFTIYGIETRPAGREVRFESEILEVINPSSDVITTDDTKPVGYIDTSGAHIGYRARLWKVVLEDGREVSRTPVNNSSYAMTPRSATVGTATSDAAVRSEIMAAVETGSIDYVQNVIALLNI